MTTTVEEVAVKDSDSESSDGEMDVNSAAKLADDSSSDSDEEADTNPRIAELETRVQSNPYLYDCYVELITLLRQDGDLEKLRDARNNMSKYHPLSEELWLDWLNDEVKFLSPESSRDDMYKLFERATTDYLSVPIWLEYVQFSIGGMGTKEGMQKCRDVFEKALSCVGLHVAKGSHIWEAYRELETAVLSGLEPDLGAVTSKETEDEISKQTERITNLFKRQLAIPLLDMEQTFNEYKDWADDDGKSLKPVYQKTLQKLGKIKPFELKLLSETPPSLSVYSEYLDFELKQGEPPRIQCLFERAIKDHCLVPEIWVRYLTYLDEHLKVESLTLPVYERAIRNCAWNVDIWMRYLRAMERHHKDHNDIKGIFEQALSAGFTDSTQYLLLWSGYCDYLRRRIDWTTGHEDELEIFRISVERGMQHLYQMYGNDGDPLCTLHQYWAAIEARYCRNMTKCRELWNEVMTRGHGNEAKMWLEFLTLERSHGDSKHCRKLLQRAVNSVTDWPEVICEAYINFEREEGTLSDYDLAVSKSKSQLERIEQRRQQQREKEELQQGKGKKFEKKSFKAKNSGDDFSKGKGKNETPKGKKRKPEYEESDEQPVAKATKSDGSFKVPASPSSSKPAQEKLQPQTGAPSSGDETALPDDDVRSEEEKSETTVFVSNLSYNITEEQLEAAFRKCGLIKEVRLAKVNGKSRGFAYVEFTHCVSVAMALSLDRSLLETRPMYVSAYKQKTQLAKFKYQTSLEKNKLFVNNLPATCTKEALETIFKQHGELSDVRLVTNRSGVPRGRAYVDFVREEDATQALLKTDGLTIGEQEIEVSISHPPVRKPQTEQKDFTPTLGGGKKETGRSKAHTMVAFTPRSVHKPATTAPPKPVPKINKTESEPVAMETEMAEKADVPKMKSNADFRNLLFKK